MGVAGCGGSGTSKAQDVAADRRSAQAASLRLSDLPDGWTAMANTPNSPGVDAQLATCLGLHLNEITGDGPADFSSPDFSDDNDDTISDAVGYTASVGEARHQLAAYQASDAPRCLAAALAAEQQYAAAHPDPANPLPAGLSFGTPTVVANAPTGNGYPEIDFDVLDPFTVAGQPFETLMIIQMASKGRAMVEMDFESDGPTAPTTGVVTFLPTVLGRLTDT